MTIDAGIGYEVVNNRCYRSSFSKQVCLNKIIRIYKMIFDLFLLNDDVYVPRYLRCPGRLITFRSYVIYKYNVFFGQWDYISAHTYR